MEGTVQDSLKELLSLQSEGGSIYPKGIFPSQRHHPFLPYQREDDNLFFTTSIVRILQGVERGFSTEEREVFESIKSNAFQSYQLFKNKDGLDTYNFWQTKPSRHFPNGWLMHRFKHFQIPDDVDDTALAHITEEASKERVSRLREKLKQHANLAYKRAFNPLPHYRDLKCYSTFFGKKMYIEFDVCVLSNLMTVILTHFPEEELNEFDEGTLEFISSVVEKDEHLRHPFYSAPNYPTTSLILYHLARLIPLLPESYRARIKDKVHGQSQMQMSTSRGMNRVILENAYLKFGDPLPPESLSGMAIEGGFAIPPFEFNEDELLNDPAFFFFHAGMITAFENPIAQKLANKPFFHLRYTSKALNRALLIENMMLKRLPTC
jgi:hypothetical protein